MHSWRAVGISSRKCDQPARNCCCSWINCTVPCVVHQTTRNTATVASTREQLLRVIYLYCTHSSCKHTTIPTKIVRSIVRSIVQNVHSHCVSKEPTLCLLITVTMSIDFHNFWKTHSKGNLQKQGVSNAFYVNTLFCKIAIAILKF